MRKLGIELLVVFVGLFAALQADEWRERRVLHAAETRYLERLEEDLDTYLAAALPRLEVQKQWRDAVRHVHRSLQSGEIIGGDTETFEEGLVRLGHLPSTMMPRATYDEMVASGMFARLRSNELKRVVSDLYATQNEVERNFTWWRGLVLITVQRTYPYIEFYNDDETLVDVDTMFQEPSRRVAFDLEGLRNDPGITNGLYWAIDTHSDWVEWTARLTDKAKQARELVVAELESRR
jgi:hypothetical protein